MRNKENDLVTDPGTQLTVSFSGLKEVIRQNEQGREVIHEPGLKRYKEMLERINKEK